MTKEERKSITDRVIFNIHPASLLLSAGAVLAGLAASVIRGGIALSPAVITLLFAMLFQISGNLYYGIHRVEAIIKENKVEKFDIDPIGYKIMQPLSNAFFILAVSVGFPLFTYIRWWAIPYLAIVMLIVYLNFGGPYPLVKTRWSAFVTFLLFGPVAVSGTAFIQRTSLADISPLLAYSAISGLLAANANLALQYLRRNEDVKDGMTSLLAVRGKDLVRGIYLFDVLAICAIMLIWPATVGFDSIWYAVLVSVILLGSALFVFNLMKHDTVEAAFEIRKICMLQYVLIIIVMLCLVLYSTDSFWLTFFSRHH